MGEVLYAAERFDRWQPQVVAEVPLAIDVKTLPQERWTQQRFVHFLGAVAGEQTVQANPETTGKKTKQNLFEAIIEAAQKPEVEHGMLDINIMTAACELSFKTDYISNVDMQFNDEGILTQFGQEMPDIQRNSLLRPNRHQKLQEITKIEALNSHRMPDLARAGLLEDYWYIVPSHIPDVDPDDPHTLTEKDLGDEGDGYFLSSMSSVSQGVTMVNGELHMQSVFQAGVIDGYEKTFEERMKTRYDLKVTQELHRRLGLEVPQNAYDALHGHLIHKSLLKNGMADYMKLRDEIAQELTGEALLRDDEFYKTLPQKSKEKNDSLQDACKAIKADLIAAYKRGEIADKFKAIEALWDIAFEHVTTEAMQNTHIQADAWGSTQATQYIQESRRMIQQGDQSGAMMMLQMFKRVAVGTGCGGGARGKQSGETAGEEGTDSIFGGAAGSDSGAEEEEKANIPTEIRCIACDEKSPRNQVIKPASWRCPHCKYEIDICDGSVINPPDIKPRNSISLAAALGKALQSARPKAA